MKVFFTALALTLLGQEIQATETASIKYDDITLDQLMEYCADMGSTLPRSGPTEPTGQLLTINKRLFQIRSLYYQNNEAGDADLPFAAYVRKKGLNNLKPTVVNQGYGPLLMYHLKDQDFYFYLCVRPQPLSDNVLEDDLYPIRQQAINPSLIQPEPSYTLRDILKKLPQFAQSTSSWTISTCIGKRIKMDDGRLYEIRQAFFEDPLNKLSSRETVQSFAESHNLIDRKTTAINYAKDLMVVFYRPAYDAENHIVLYIAMGIVEE